MLLKGDVLQRNGNVTYIVNRPLNNYDTKALVTLIKINMIVMKDKI
jgi:hypothetical protein